MQTRKKPTKSCRIKDHDYEANSIGLKETVSQEPDQVSGFIALDPIFSGQCRVARYVETTSLLTRSSPGEILGFNDHSYSPFPFLVLFTRNHELGGCGLWPSLRFCFSVHPRSKE